MYKHLLRYDGHTADVGHTNVTHLVAKMLDPYPYFFGKPVDCNFLLGIFVKKR